MNNLESFSHSVDGPNILRPDWGTESIVDSVGPVKNLSLGWKLWKKEKKAVGIKNQ